METSSADRTEPATSTLANGQGASARDAIVRAESRAEFLSIGSAGANIIVEELERAGYVIVPARATVKLKNATALCVNNIGKRWGPLYEAIVALAATHDADLR